jgi:PAS domain S-box-containing protein
MTGRKEIEQALQQAEKKYRDIFENASEGIFQIDREGRFVSANPALAYLHLYESPEELMTLVHHVREELFIDPDDHAMLIRLLKEHDRVQNFEVRMRRKDGNPHWISINVRTVRDETGRTVLHEGTMRSISKRKEAEAALAESEERYRTVIEHSNDGIAIAHRGIHVYVNRRLYEMFGYDGPDMLTNKPITLIVHPDDRQRLMEIHARRWKGLPVPARYEFKALTKQGGTILVEVSATGITYRNLPMLLVFIRDITERKRAEEALLHSHRELEQLNRAKTKAVNHVAHELKTPLAVIQGNIRILKRKLEGAGMEDQVKGIMESTERNLERLLRMQRDTDEIFRTSQEVEEGTLLDGLNQLEERLADLAELPPQFHSHLDAIKEWADGELQGRLGTQQVLDLYPLAMQSVEKARHAAAQRQIDVRLDGQNDLYIMMDPSILRNVIDGLVRNAIENTPDGGSVTLTVEEKDRFILLHVADTGVGITEENQRYIFDGLFHAKETELYASKRAYEFGAGGKGLDLLRMKVYAGRFSFDLSVRSTRCRYIPSDQDVCPGDIAQCTHCRSPRDCHESGGTAFTISFVKRV